MDLLAFKNFISIEVLIIVYYIGAILLPIIIWFFIPWVIHKYKLVNAAYGSVKNKMIKMKEFTNREKDKIDVNYLKKIKMSNQPIQLISTLYKIKIK